MTIVHFSIPNGDLSGPAVGYIAVATYHREQGGSGISHVEIGPEVDYALVDGETTIDLAPNTSANAWQISERVIGGITRLVSVPDVGGTVEYDGLPSIDGRTLLPVAEPTPAWYEAIEDMVTSEDFHRIQAVTQAEKDAIDASPPPDYDTTIYFVIEG